MKIYETMVIVTPNLSKEERDAQVEEISKRIEKLDGKIIKVERWGMRKLAYPIKKFTEGDYALIYFSGEEGDFANELSAYFRVTPNILRYMTIRDYHFEKKMKKGVSIEKLLGIEEKVENEESQESGE
jgi:small subunit ribosomal protein S6